ncbi:hypothetical protein ES703_29625 [subsurface metagenome]
MSFGDVVRQGVPAVAEGRGIGGDANTIWYCANNNWVYELDVSDFSTIRELDPDTTYHFRAFAINAAGTSYGADTTFTTAEAISRGYALSRQEL